MATDLLGADNRQASRKKVGIADLVVVDDDTHLITSGLGSCLAIVLFDPQHGVSGLLHAMLPHAEAARDSTPTKFVDTGVEALISQIEAAGGDPRRLQAWLVGGSQMLEFSGGEDSIGARNIDAAKQILSSRSIPIVGVDVGGSHGRSIEFRPADAALSVRTADGTEQSLS
ncbi:chemotaxis protein CheD [Halalkalirubrum salinum]|uniref:chemotaxis protein CheD n=1 Tax=Halalkalirubrum salinum TaxID=2563889 RepID=UPI0010FAEE13|nr:chemotaxis protein CheD [Halalkalirubrum salinum]